MSSALDTNEPIETEPTAIQLDEQQQLAVDHDAGPLAVLAGPGAGKTSVIVQRIVRMCEQGIDPEHIVALAFTIKSAGEMRERLAEHLEPAITERLFVGTSHSFGKRLLDRFGDTIGVNPGTRLTDSAQCKRLLRELIYEHDLLASYAAHGRTNAISEVIAFAERCRNDDVSLERAAEWIELRHQRLESGEHDLDPEALRAERARIPHDRDIVRLVTLFERERVERGMMLFDDFLMLPLRILRQSESAASIIRSDFRHIVVDEFQDWNPGQIKLLSQLAPPTTASGRPADVCVVGDDDQSIYAFRGADDRAFQRFAELYPNKHVITLATNYRSDPLIVSASQHIIQQATDRFDPDKKLVANKDHDPTSTIECTTIQKAADDGPVVASCLLHDHHANAIPWKDLAVLVRTNTALTRVLGACDLRGIPTATRFRSAPLDDDSVLDLLAWCRLIVDPTRNHDVQRLLLRPPIALPVEELNEWTAHWRRVRKDVTLLQWMRTQQGEHPAVRDFLALHEPLSRSCPTLNASTAIREIIDAISPVEAQSLSPLQKARRIESIVQVVKSIDAMLPLMPEPGNLRAFLDHYDDLDTREQQFRPPSESMLDGDTDEQATDAVSVLTAHSAKGLEFQKVYVVGVNPMGKGGVPSTQAPDDALVELDTSLTGRQPSNHLDEERRIFYVACTRAEHNLTLIARHKKNRGKGTDYFYEIKDDADVEISESTGQEALERVGTTDTTEQELRSSRATRQWLNEEITQARGVVSSSGFRAASRTLHDEEFSTLREQADDALQRIRGLSQLASRGTIDEALLAHQRLGEYFVSCQNRYQSDESASSIFKPLAAPLTLSFTQIDSYLNCPRCFFVRHVLRLEEAGASYLSVGNIVHSSIEHYLRLCAEAEADSRTAPEPGMLVQTARERFERESLLRDAPNARDLREQIDVMIANYIDHFHDPDAELLVIEGTSPDRSSVVRPFPYEHAGHTHSIVAKPDRVERLPDGTYRIADYKTGNASKRLTSPGKTDLQMAIYALSLRHYFELDAPPQGQAQYWLLRENTVGTLVLDDIDWEKVRTRINTAIDGMLEGRFDKSSTRGCYGACDILGRATDEM
ncbi:MAG: ATP-dependent helicase [Planctomycetota bacterium]|jgi:DNA helicase-2/ATP-dependent DNA helicase PcrA